MSGISARAAQVRSFTTTKLERALEQHESAGGVGKLSATKGTDKTRFDKKKDTVVSEKATLAANKLK